MAEKERPTTIIESFKTMDAMTIRKLVLEAEAYLEEQAFTATLAVLKVALGHQLYCGVRAESGLQPENMKVFVRTTDKMTSNRWKILGKFITTAGILFEKAGVSFIMKTESSAEPITEVRLYLPKYHAKFHGIMEDNNDAGGGEISAQDVLALFDQEVPDDTNI